MKLKRSSQEDGGPKVPAYIVTFSDMVTLLLTFFVMLLTLANEQDPELFAKSRDSFVQDLNHIGLGMLFGAKDSPDFGKAKIKYYIGDVDKQEAARTVDAGEERLRRRFRRVTESMDTIKSQVEAERTHFQVTDIRFRPGDPRLDTSAGHFLKQFTSQLLQDVPSGDIKLYVLGLAPDIQGAKQQWIESAQRAQSVADRLQALLPQEFDCPVFGWGAGAGGQWLERNSQTAEGAHILIAMMRSETPALP